MPLDAYPGVHRRTRGATHVQDGLCAETSVAAAYESRGHRLVARRWRGTVGEVDLVLSDATGYVFAEVKAFHIPAIHRLAWNFVSKTPGRKRR